MGIGKRIKEARTAKGLTQEELASMLNVTKSAVANYENEVSHPKEQILYALIDALEVDANYLFQDCVKLDINKTAPPITVGAIEIAKRYDVLDEHGKEVIEKLLDCEETRLRQQKPAPTTKIIPLLGNSFAAGRGEPDFGNPWEDYEVPIDTKADFAIRINGDSMEPYLPDGSVQLCRKGEPRDGEVGVFVLDGEYLCKQACVDCYGNLYLFSLNRARSDADTTVWASADRQVGCYGTVIMPRRVPLP